jgi:hypothetical protein
MAVGRYGNAIPVELYLCGSMALWAVPIYGLEIVYLLISIFVISPRSVSIGPLDMASNPDEKKVVDEANSDDDVLAQLGYTQGKPYESTALIAY